MSDELANNNIVNISIKEIIEELSSYTGIAKKDIGISTRSEIGYWGCYNLDYLAYLIDSENQDLGYYHYDKNKHFTVTIYADKNLYSYDKKLKFSYDLILDLNLNEIQSDGKTLLEHCREQLYFDDARESHYTGIVIDKDIESLNYKANLNDIEKYQESRDFYPSELFKQVILNIIEKRNIEKPKEKILK